MIKLLTTVNGTFLNGITRQSIVQLLSDDGYRVEEKSIDYAELLNADELFATRNYSKVSLCMNIDDLSAGHAVAWDGCKIYDPDSPRIMSEKEFRKHYPYVNAYDVTIIKIGFHRRVANMFKTIWYDSRDWFNDRHQL